MKKTVLGIIFGLFSLPVFSNGIEDYYLNTYYPSYSNEYDKCRLMQNNEPARAGHAVCIVKVINKYFEDRDEGYLIVLGENKEGSHVASGIVDIYAYGLAEGGYEITSSIGNQMGSWGYPPVDWTFKKRKNKSYYDGSVTISTQTGFTNQGVTETTTHSFRVISPETGEYKFKYTTK